MLQARDSLRLGQEARDSLGVGVEAGQDHLQDAGAVQQDLAGAIDHTHAAPAQLAQDFIALDGRGGAVRPLRRDLHR